MDDTYKLQLIRLGGILADKNVVEPSKFSDERLRRIVSDLEKRNASSLKEFLDEIGCPWDTNLSTALEAVEEAIRVDAEYERAMQCAKEVFGFWIRPKGSKTDVINQVRSVCTEDQLKKWGL